MTLRIAVIGQKFKGQTDLTEKWYGTEYSITNITEEKLQVGKMGDVICMTNVKL